MSVSSGGGLVFSDISNLGKGTDWQKEIFRIDAPIITNNISVSGGTNNSSYFLSAGFTGQEGILYGGDKNFFDRSTFRGNFDIDISSKLNMKISNR